MLFRQQFFTCEGGARVKCVGGLEEFSAQKIKFVGGLEEFSAQKQHIKYCKGVQHNYKLAKNTKKELDTAQYNDASSTGY